MIKQMDYNTINYFITNNFQPITIDGKVALSLTQLKYLLSLHCGKSFISHNENANEGFNDLWNGFIANHKPQYEQIFKALELEYDPLENTNRRTEYTHGAHTDTDTNSVARRHNKTESFNDPYGYNSETYSHGDRVNATADSDPYTDTISKAYTQYTDTEEMHGNVGVRSSQELIEQEKELRMFNINRWLVDIFVKDNLFYC